MRRLFTPAEMNRLSDLIERPDIANAVGEDSEMVEGGYIADLSPKQMAYLATRFLPTGEVAPRERRADG
jgi:hypothetical protein